MTEPMTEVARKLDAAWKRIDVELSKAEPLLLARIAEVVREDFPEAVAILLETTDQNHYGWVLDKVELADGTQLGYEELDAVSDALWPHLDNLGFHFLSSESHPSPHRLELEPRKED